MLAVAYWMSFLLSNKHFYASITVLLLQIFNSSCHFHCYYGFESLFAAGNSELAQQCDMKCSARLLVSTVGALLQSSSMVCMCLSLQFVFSIYFPGNPDSCFCFAVRLGEMLKRQDMARACWRCTLLTCKPRSIIHNNNFCSSLPGKLSLMAISDRNCCFF